MKSTQLYDELNYVNHSKERRLFYAKILISQPELVRPLLDILFKIDDKTSSRAAWVFEYMCGENIECIIPHLNFFTKNISRVHLDSSVRPVAKICEYLAKAFYSKTENTIKTHLKEQHKEQIIESCFDWMIRNEKVAVKAYSMSTLFLFGKDFSWIHPELKLILSQNFANESAAYKARARHIIKKLKTS